MNKTYISALLGAALLLSTVWGQQTKPAQPAAQPAASSGQQTKPGQSQPAAKQAPSAEPEDAEIQRLKQEHERLLKQKEIEKLRQENEKLKDPSQAQGQAKTQPPPAPPAKPLSPEDEEIKRLEAERQRLLKEREIEQLRKENEALKAQPPAETKPDTATAKSKQAQPAPAPKSNCTPQAQQGSRVKVKKPSQWTCQHLGICVEDKPVTSAGNGCPDSSGSGQPVRR